MSHSLELHNFKRYKEEIFEFPNNGIVLLEGESGSGKTTIMNAILFCLYGEGKKVATYGEKKCSVIFKFQGDSFIRTKGPNTLSVITKDERIEGTVAQEYINNKFGRNFTVTSYITQKNVDSLIGMTPSNRLEFLERLAFENTDIDNIKKICKDKIRERKIKLTQKTAELATIQKEYDSLTEPKEVPFPYGSRHPTRSGEEKKVKLAEERMKKCVEEKIKLSSEIRQLKIKIKKQEELVTKLNMITTTINNLTTELFNLQDEHYLIIVTQNELDELTQTISTLEYQRKINETRDELQVKRDKLRELKMPRVEEIKELREKLKLFDDVKEKLAKLKDIKGEIRKRDELKDELVKLEKEWAKHGENSIEDYEADIKSIVEEIEEKNKENDSIIKFRSIKKCPKCGEHLRIDGDKVVLASCVEPERNEKELGMEIRELRNEANKLREIIKQLYTLQTKIGVVKKELGKVTCVESLDKINSEISELLARQKEEGELNFTLNSLIEEQKIYEYEKKRLTSEISLHENSLVKMGEIKSVKGNVKELEQQVINIRKELIKKETLARMITRKKKEIEKSLVQQKEIQDNVSSDDYQEQLTKAELSLEKADEEERELYQKQIQYQQYLGYKKELEVWNGWKRKLAEAKDQEESSKKSLSVAETFNRKILETESIALYNFINNLNANIKYYIDQFFEYPLTLVVESFKENSTTGEMKANVNIAVSYKGTDCNVEELSGGEYDRCLLAICLALNNMINSKIIMLDEALSSIQSDLVETIIDVLKEDIKSNNKLVLVTLHQATKGVFDHILKISTD